MNMSKEFSSVPEIAESLLGRKVTLDDGFGICNDWDSMIQLQLLIQVEKLCKRRFSLGQLSDVFTLQDWINLSESGENG